MTRRRLRDRAAGVLDRVRGDLALGDHVYLIAPAGHPNYGDELLLRTWLRVLARLCPRTRVVVDCHTPGQAALLHRGAHPEVTFTDTVWRLVAEAAHAPEPGRAAVDLVHRALRDQGIRPALAAGVDELLAADVVHVIGGGFVGAHWPHHLGVLAAATEIARISGADAVATGQGLTPAADPELTAEVLSGFDLVTVRDTPSVGVAGTGAEFLGDDAWLASSDWATPHDLFCRDPEVARDVVVCLQSDLGDTDAVTAVASRILRGWAVPGERITVVEGIPGRDRVVWDRLVDSAAGAELGLDAARFMSFHEMWRAGLPARPGQAWLTTRFHPHLLAAAAGASGVALTVDPVYYATKHGSLSETGSPWEIRGVTGDDDDDEVTPLPTAGGIGEDILRSRVHTAEAVAARIYRPD